MLKDNLAVYSETAGWCNPLPENCWLYKGRKYTPFSLEKAWVMHGKRKKKENYFIRFFFYSFYWPFKTVLYITLWLKNQAFFFYFFDFLEKPWMKWANEADLDDLLVPGWLPFAFRTTLTLCDIDHKLLETFLKDLSPSCKYPVALYSKVVLMDWDLITVYNVFE